MLLQSLVEVGGLDCRLYAQALKDAFGADFDGYRLVASDCHVLCTLNDGTNVSGAVDSHSVTLTCPTLSQPLALLLVLSWVMALGKVLRT